MVKSLKFVSACDKGFRECMRSRGQSCLVLLALTQKWSSLKLYGSRVKKRIRLDGTVKGMPTDDLRIELARRCADYLNSERCSAFHLPRYIRKIYLLLSFKNSHFPFFPPYTVNMFNQSRLCGKKLKWLLVNWTWKREVLEASDSNIQSLMPPQHQGIWWIPLV